MHQTAEAKARAANSLDEAARALKRAIGTCRTTLQTVRQAQAEIVGIEVETITQPGGTDDHSSDSITSEDHEAA